MNYKRERERERDRSHKKNKQTKKNFNLNVSLYSVFLLSLFFLIYPPVLVFPLPAYQGVQVQWYEPIVL